MHSVESSIVKVNCSFVMEFASMLTTLLPCMSGLFIYLTLWYVHIKLIIDIKEIMKSAITVKYKSFNGNVTYSGLEHCL